MRAPPGSRWVAAQGRPGALTSWTRSLGRWLATATGGASATLSGAALLKLARDPDVAYITTDHLVRAKFDPTAAAANVTSPGILETKAPAVWSSLGITGRGIGIAVVDSGVAAHPDLA